MQSVHLGQHISLRFMGFHKERQCIKISLKFPSDMLTVATQSLEVDATALLSSCRNTWTCWSSVPRGFPSGPAKSANVENWNKENNLKDPITSLRQDSEDEVRGGMIKVQFVIVHQATQRRGSFHIQRKTVTSFLNGETPAVLEVPV